MGWTKRAILGFAIIAPLKDIIGYGPWGRATNKSLDSMSDGSRQLAAWVDRLDDKEFICFSCHNLFPYFDLMSRMAVWKDSSEALGSEALISQSTGHGRIEGG